MLLSNRKLVLLTPSKPVPYIETKAGKKFLPIDVTIKSCLFNFNRITNNYILIYGDGLKFKGQQVVAFSDCNSFFWESGG